MALKKKLTVEEFGKLNKLVQSEYKANPDNAEEYILDLEGDEDVSKLKSAKDHEVSARKKAEEEVRKAKAELEAILKKQKDAEQEAARASGDVVALENSWKERETAAKKAHKAELDNLQAALNATLVDGVASTVATEISTAPKLLAPHIKARLRVEIVDGVAVTRVLDKDGKPSASSVEDLKKEFLDNSDYLPILTASKGSGSGAHRTNPNGGAGGGGKGKIDFTKSSPGEIAAHLKQSGRIKEGE